MEFIQKMKKREFIEMGLKALAALLAAFVAIILMEGMIYGITLNSYIKNGDNVTFSPETTAYCIEVEEDQYFVLAYDGESWGANANKLYTKAQCDVLTVGEVIYHAPNAFLFTINGVHYAVMAVFVAVVAGFFVWRFLALAKEYKGIEETFAKTGEIEIA